MAHRGTDPRRLGVEAFAREHGSLQGQWPIGGFARLLEAAHPEALPAPGDAVSWHVEGELRKPRSIEPQCWLHLRGRAALALVCQRCLGPLPVEVEIDRRIRFVHGEPAAEALDAEIEEDVLDMDRALDVHALLEDELILALPIVPRHESGCPEPLPVIHGEAAVEVEPRPHPFAALAHLKRGG